MPTTPPDPERGSPRPDGREVARETGGEEGELFRLAGRILEGESMDWDPSSPPPGMESARVVKQLRLIGSLAEFHRTAQRKAVAGAPPAELQRWGHLEIIERIGSGSFGTVFHARDPKLDREVALKILHPRPGARALWASEFPAPGSAESNGDEAAPAIVPESLEAMIPPSDSPGRRAQAIDEARLLAKVQHPNIVAVFGADEHDGLIGIWMELIAGETLWNRVRKQGSLGAGEVIAIGHDLLAALAAVHAAGILHRDLKPQNVMRAVGGRIVLMDFGIGMDLRQQRELTEDRVLGAALYAAPERLRGAEATVRSDLYSLGVLLYFLVTGRHPFEGENFAQLVQAHERGARVHLRDRRPDLPGPLVEVIERALSSEPERRYASAGEMELALTVVGPSGRGRPKPKRWFPEIHLPRPDWRKAALLLAVPFMIFLALRLGAFGRYSIDAALCRELPHGGQASLTSRDLIGPNDRLFMEFQASRALHLYVLRREADGSILLLFPNPRNAERNPLARRVPHRLPNLFLGQDLNWEEASTDGSEQFLFVASPARLAGLEPAPGLAPRPGRPEITRESLALELMRILPGGRRGSAESRAELDRLLAQVRFLRPGEQPVRGVWIRKLELARAPRSYQPPDTHRENAVPVDSTR